MNDALKKSGMRLVGLVVDQGEAKKADGLLRQAHLPIRYRFRAEGTASSEMLDYFGLTRSDKVVLLCTVPAPFTRRLLDVLRRELDLEKLGRGMAFSVPMASMSNPLAQMMDRQMLEGLQNNMENEVLQMAEDAKYSLVLAIVDQGYSEDVMEAAKAAGARGGTVVRARRLGMEDAMKFWGISLQSERELVGILIPKTERNAVMKAIGEHCGAQSAAKGLILSLPVDGLVGAG